jgi:putative SOS response-associated peptidase YedK
MTIRSTTLITRAAASDIAFIHDRMPLIIPDKYRKQWLDPDTSQKEIFKNNVADNNFEY